MRLIESKSQFSILAETRVPASYFKEYEEEQQRLGVRNDEILNRSTKDIFGGLGDDDQRQEGQRRSMVRKTSQRQFVDEVSPNAVELKQRFSNAKRD